MIAGWRGWGLAAGQLVAPHRGDVWTPGVMGFRHCFRRVPDPHSGRRTLSDAEHPHPECPCGFYAHRTLDAALARAGSWAYLRAYNPRHLPQTGLWVIGQVALWGRVVEHEHGWRASRAKPICLVVDDGWWRHQREPIVVDTGSRYRPRTVPSPRVLAQVAARHGVPLVGLSDVAHPRAGGVGSGRRAAEVGCHYPTAGPP